MDVMGLFGRLFKKEPEHKEINIADTEAWLASKTDESFDNLNANLKQIFSKTEETIQSIQQAIAVLQNAEIRDKEKIQPKVKSVVLGHRQNYIRKLNQLIGAIQQPVEVNHHTALEFYRNVQQELNRFSQETTKSFYAVQHLFHKEVEDIAVQIKWLDRHLLKIKKFIEKSRAVEIETAKQQIRNIQRQISRKTQLKKEIEQAKARVENTRQSKEHCRQKIDELQQSKEFKDLNKLNEDLNKTKQDLQDIENQITQIFSPLGRALKKFSKITLEHENLVKSYSEKPMHALLGDKEIKIITLLQNMKKSILSDAVELKDRKKQKTLETIEQLTSNYLKLIITNYNELREKKHLLEKQIKANTAIQTEKELKYKLEHANWISDKIRANIAELEKNYQKIDIEKLKQGLEQEIKNLTKTELRIII